MKVFMFMNFAEFKEFFFFSITNHLATRFKQKLEFILQNTKKLLNQRL